MRLSLAYTLGNRDATTQRDERILNGFAELEGDQKKGGKSYAIKRPGLINTYLLATGVGGATQGQLLFSVSTPSAPGMAGTSALIGIRGDKLTRPVV